ncbi:MAG TPA: hypothetical protein VJG83_03010 [archaeon]|nr:hypothetical protein [archaeon]
MEQTAGKPELSEREGKVLQVVRERWPISAIEVAAQLNENISSRENKKKHSTNYTYYLKKLVRKRLILSKRIGNALIVWPLEVEAYRAIQKILQEA